MLDGVTSLNDQSLVAWLFHNLAHELHDLFFKNHFHLCRAFASCLPSNCPDPFHAQDCGVRLVNERWLIPHGVN